MAGAYAAVVSLRHVLEDILHPTQQWILLDRRQIQYLLEKITSFQHFLEDYHAIPTSKPEAEDGLESQMVKAIYAAEDMIESFVLDQILAPSQVQVERILTSFSQDFPKVMQGVDSIDKKVMEIKEKIGVVKDQQPVNSLQPAAAFSRIVAPGSRDAMVGFESHLHQIMERLVGQEAKLQMISIVGMGGIGKTTLASNVFDHPTIVENFDIRAWVTISQEYSVREILLALLHDIEMQFCKRKQEDISNSLAKSTYRMSKGEHLGEQLYKHLFGRRYLIVMDDMWSTKVWDEVRPFFPNNSNKSRIMITTRLSNVAVHFGPNAPHEMSFHDEDKSWNLFCEKVFLEEACPPKLEEIGKKIVKGCGGLPLALVVIGGLVAKSEKTTEKWEYIAENLNSIINSRNDEQCLKILSLSYSYLPIHLKPCFLYMATFPRNCRIRISKFVKLWIAERFLRPTRTKSLEDVAMEYVNDLIDRNLVIVSKRGTTRKIKSCTVHDLLRDFCIQEMRKERQLRHLKFQEIILPDPTHQSHHTDGQDSYILENLQTLSTVKNFRFTEEANKRVPNIKKMKIYYSDFSEGLECSHYCLDNLVLLSKLESLTCEVYSLDKISTRNLAFPRSLKKLTLRGCGLPWDDTRIVGSLPNLEVFKLEGYAFQGPEWNPIDGEFVRLKFLLIGWTDLEHWRAESTHFPSLEHLVLYTKNLDQIPLGLAEVHALRLIQLMEFEISDSVVNSVKQMKEERESLGVRGSSSSTSHLGWSEVLLRFFVQS